MLTILVVDDERAIADALVVLLGEAGFNAISVYHPHAAIHRCHGEIIDVLLTDFMMPDMNGDALIANVRAIRKETCTILMSSLAEESVRRLTADFDAFLQKPFEIERLIQVVDQSCGPIQRPQLRVVKSSGEPRS